MPSTVSAHAVRNPAVNSSAANETNALRNAQAKLRKAEYADAIDEAFAVREATAARIAERFDKDISKVRAALVSKSQYKATRKPTLRNAIVHQRTLDLHAEVKEITKTIGKSKRLQELRQEVDEEIENGTLVLAEIPKAEHDRLIQQVLEARELKKTGVRGTTMAALMDATQTAKSVQRGVTDLYDRTGVRALALFSHGNVDDPALPWCVDSDGATRFFKEELGLSHLDVLRRTKASFIYMCLIYLTNGPHVTGEKKSNGSRTVKKELSKIFNEGLRKIKKNPKLTMEYVWYDVDIREGLGIELAGWPQDVKMQRPAEWNTETAHRILGMLHTGAIHWVHMTKTQHKALIEEHNRLRALSGDGALKRRATRSDVGTKRTKKTDKASAGKKKKQRGKTSEDEDDDNDTEDEDEGRDEDEDEDEDEDQHQDEDDDEDKGGDDEEDEDEEDEERDNELEAGKGPAGRNDTTVVPTERTANSALAPGAGSAIFDAFGQSLSMPSPVPSGADAAHGPVLDESLAFRPLAFPIFNPDADFDFNWTTLQLDMHATMSADPFTYAPTYGPTPNVPWLQPAGTSSEESDPAAPSAAVLNTTNLNAAGPLTDSPTAPVAKRKRTAAKDAADAPAAKKARKAAKKKAAGGENAPPAAEGSAPSKKPRKTRSDKGSKRRK
ncbi:hypothetical protein B0H13DRAFT_1918526 [Mycena leptocephala]|nr:hypothetical protein B0H13DRAFT_1918526 [Mycena leptocephala]